MFPGYYMHSNITIFIKTFVVKLLNENISQPSVGDKEIITNENI